MMKNIISFLMAFSLTIAVHAQPLPVVKEFEVDVSKMKPTNLLFLSVPSIVKMDNTVCALHNDGFIMCYDGSGQPKVVDVRPKNAKGKSQISLGDKMFLLGNDLTVVQIGGFDMKRALFGKLKLEDLYLRLVKYDKNLKIKDEKRIPFGKGSLVFSGGSSALMFIEPIEKSKFIVGYVSNSGSNSVLRVNVFNDKGETVNQIAIPLPFEELSSFKYMIDGKYLNVFIPTVLKEEEIVNRKILGPKKKLTDKQLFVTYYRIELDEGSYETYLLDLGNPERTLSHLYVSKDDNGHYYVVVPWFIEKKSGLKKVKVGSITAFKLGVNQEDGTVVLKDQFMFPVEEGTTPYILDAISHDGTMFVLWARLKAYTEVNTSRGTTRFKVELRDLKLTIINESSRQHKSELIEDGLVYLLIYPGEGLFNPLSFSGDLPHVPVAKLIPLSDNKIIAFIPYMLRAWTSVAYVRIQKGTEWRSGRPSLIHPSQDKNKLYGPAAQGVYLDKDKKLLYVFWRKKWKNPVLSIHRVNF